MKRIKIQALIQWKERRNRKPLILLGARQVGKSHLLGEFGSKQYRQYHHLDFERDADQLLPLFEHSLSPKILIQNLSLFLRKKIDLDNDLLIFDEIQAAPRALTSLKYFCEEMPQLNLCAAGSLLGITLAQESFPVGKVEYLHLHPMNFEEFLYATENDMLINIFRDFKFTPSCIPEIAHSQLWERLKQFYVTGGMPAAIKAFIQCTKSPTEGFSAARDIQKNILRDYNADFNKHAGKLNAMHIANVFSNIPLQLAQAVDASTNRYRFKDVIPNRKSFTELEGPISWLTQAGLVHKIMINNRPEQPLKSFCKPNAFKLMLLDHGLLAAALDLSPGAIILQDYGISKGYFAESFVAQELLTAGTPELFCWADKQSEIEFLQVYNDQITPIEVKAGNRLRAKSLSQYMKRYAPKTAYKISSKPFSIDGPLTNIPLYLAGKIARLHEFPTV